MRTLTGCDIHEAFKTAYQGEGANWNLLSPATQAKCETMAKHLNERLASPEQPLQGEKSDFTGCTFILGYGPGDHDFTTARSIEDLHQCMKEHLPYPNEGQIHHYYIRVHKQGQDLGFGSYDRTHADIEIKQETGVARGLNDALYVYAWEHA